VISGSLSPASPLRLTPQPIGSGRARAGRHRSFQSEQVCRRRLSGDCHSSSVLTSETLSIPVKISVAPRQEAHGSFASAPVITAFRGGVTPPQTFAVLNKGARVLTCVRRRARLRGLGLAVGIACLGNQRRGGPPDESSVRVNPSGIFRPGVYYGVVAWLPRWSNALQDVQVVLNLLHPATIPAAVEPSGSFSGGRAKEGPGVARPCGYEFEGVDARFALTPRDARIRPRGWERFQIGE